jgi:hypothetical protein
MEIIIFIAVVVVAALLWSGYVKTKKTESDQAIDSWEPAKILNSKDEPWPYGEKLPEGKIHVKVADVAPVAPTSSEDRVEAPAPVVEPVPAKKPAAKKTAAKPAAAKKPAVKKAPAKKSST